MSSSSATVIGNDSEEKVLDAGAQLTIPVIALGGVLVAFIVFSLLGGVLRRVYLRRKELDLSEEFRGPCWVWLCVLTSSPLLVALLGILVSAGISFQGVVDSNYSLNIDMDVANYMRADSELMRVETALARAVRDQEQREASTSSRRLNVLARQLAWYWTLDIYFESTDGGTVFTVDALQEMKAFERDLVAFHDYEQYCLKEGDSCIGPESVTNIFFSTQVQSNQSHVLTTFNGEGTLQNIRETLERFSRQGINWWTDTSFSATNLASQYTRSRFRGGVPLVEGDYLARLPEDKKASGVWLKKLHDEFLLNVNDGRYKHIIVSWDEQEHLYPYEVMATLWHDCRWSIGAFAFVIGFVAIQVRSLFLTFAAMIGVVLSFSTGYYFYYSVAGYHEMNLVNFIALFLVTGIAADDILVMFNTYELSEAVVALKETLQPVDRMLWTYYRAGGAMLVTTATTCGSFFSLGISSLFVVRRFGFFMGTVVALNYVHVMVIFPSLLLVKELYWPVFLRIICCRRAKASTEDTPALEDSAPPTETPRSHHSADSADVETPAEGLPSNKKSPTLPTQDSADMTTTGASASSLTNKRAAFQKVSTSHVSKLFTERRSIETVDSLNMKFLGPFARFFRGPFFFFVKKTRYALIVAVLAISGIAAWRASEDLIASSGLPQVFVQSRNIGRLLRLSTSVFSSYADGDFNDALRAFSRTQSVQERVCPSGENGIRCSGHGTCDTTTWTCVCNVPHFGADCSDSIKGSVLVAQPGSLRLPVIGVPGQPYTGDVIIREVLILNNGDEATTWALSTPTEPWLTVSPTTGTIGQRSIVGGVAIPTTAVVEVRVDLNGQALGWNSVQTLSVVGDVGATTGSLVIDAGVVAGPELLHLLPVPSSVPLTSLSAATLANPPVTILPSFSGRTRSYSAALGYRDSSVRILVAFEAPTVSVRVDGNASQTLEIQGYTGAVSHLIDLVAGASRQIRVEALTQDAVVGTYLLTLTRGQLGAPGPVSLQRVIASNNAITVVFAPPVNDGGEAITSYNVNAQQQTSRRLLESGRMLTQATGCTPAPCWSHDRGEQAGDACCEHHITGLPNGVAYTVTIQAVNSEGTGQLSLPALGDWPWPAVTPRSVPLAPSINTVPTVKRQHGEVDLSIDESSVIQGDAVPLGDFLCVASPGGANASGRSPIVITGLDTSQEYTFTCSIANARPHPSGGVSTSAPSPATSPLIPNVPTPLAPEITSIVLTAGVLTVSVAVVDENADLLNCLASNDPNDVQVEVGLSGSAQRDLQLGGLTQGAVHDLSCKIRNFARGRSVAHLWSPLQTLQVPPAPQAPQLLAAPTQAGANTLDVAVGPPADDGYGPLGGFSCAATSPGLAEVSAESGSSPVRISGLQTGASYTVACKVKRPVPGLSTSFIESSPSASSSPVVVGTEPSPPTIIGLTVDSSGPQALVTVEHVETVPPVLEYRCGKDQDLQAAVSFNLTGEDPLLEWTISVPVPDGSAPYTFYCWAANVVGVSSPSAPWIHTITTTTITTTTPVATSTETTVTATSSTATTVTATTTTATTSTRTTTTISTVTSTMTTSTLTTEVGVTLTTMTSTTTLTPQRTFVQGFLDLQTLDATQLDTPEGRAALIQAISAVTGVAPGQIDISLLINSGGRRLDEATLHDVVVLAASIGGSKEDQEASQVASTAPTGHARRLTDTIRINFQIVVSAGSEGGVQSNLNSAGASGMTSAVNTALSDAAIPVSVDVQTTTTTVTSSTTSISSTTTATATSTATTSATATATVTATATTTTATTSTETSTTWTATTTSTTTTLPPPPLAPTVESIQVSGDGQVTLLLNAGGDESIDGAKCAAVEESSYTGTSSSLSVDVSGLPPGMNFTFQCAVRNTRGWSLFGDVTSPPFVVATKPAPPQVSSVAVTGDRNLTVRVEVTDDGGSEVLRTICNSVLGTTVEATSDGLEVTMSNLNAGVGYTFACAVESAAGRSDPSAASQMVTAVTPPQAPQIVCTVPKSGEVVVEVQLGSSDIRFADTTAVLCGTSTDPEVEWPVVDSSSIRPSIRNLANGDSVQVWCLSRSIAGDSERSLSQAVTPGIPVIGTFSLRQSTTADEQELRSWLAEELEADLSAVVADVALEGEVFDGCVSGNASQSTGRRLQVPERFDLQVKVFVANEQDPTVPNLLRSLNGFSGPSSPLAARTSSRVSLLQAPYLATAAHTDSTLQSLTVQDGSSPAALTLSPPFDPLVKVYEVTLTNKSFTVRAEPNSQLALPPKSEDGQELPATFETSVLSPNFTSVAVKVTAADLTSSIYHVRAFLPPQSCGDCGNGTCNALTGFCDCQTNYSGPSCLAFCPGSPVCGGRGTCSNAAKSCQCEDTYTGSDCSVRTCPPCVNGGVCQEGAQDQISEWTCQCPAAYKGRLCEDRSCPNDCSGAGQCNSQTGTCTCYASHEGDDCSQEKMTLVPLKHCVEVSLVWGLSGYDDRGDPLYDEEFQFPSPSTQQWLLEVCRLARLNPMVRSEQQCFTEAFRDHVSRSDGPGFPLTNQTALQEELQSFMRDQDRSGKADVGAESTGWGGRILYVRQRLKFNVHKSSPPNDLQKEYDKWVIFTDNVNARASSRADAGRRFRMISSSWTQMEVELGILSSTVAAFAVSVAVSLLAVLLFTGNALLSLYTVLSTVLVIATLFGIVTSVLKWEFGAVQAIGMTTFVGMSVDYTLHLAHAYHSSRAKTSFDKTKDALVHLGPAVLGGAVTTAGAAGFLFPCWIYLFHQLGVMLCINAVVAVIYSFLFLSPVMMAGGPTGRCCNIYAFICPARWCGGEVESDDTLSSPRSPRTGASSTPSAPSPKGADAKRAVEDKPLLDDRGAKSAKSPAVSSGPPPADVSPTREDDVGGILV